MFKKIILLIEPGQFKKLIFLLFLFVFVGFVEIIGVGSIIPFLNSITYSSIDESDNLTKSIYNLIQPSSYKEFLLISGFTVLTLLILSNFFRFLVLWVTSYFVWENQAKMSIRLLSYMMNRPYEDFAKENSADISKDILVETQNFVIGILMPLLVILSQSFICISILIALFLFDALVASLVTLSILLIFGIFYFLIQKPLQKEGAERFKATVERFKIVDESFSGIKLIKLLNKEDYFLNLIQKPSFGFAKAMAFQTYTKGLPRYVFEVVAFGAVVLIALLNIYQGKNINDVITIIGLFAFAGYRLLPSMSQLYGAINSLTFNNAVLERLFNQRELKIIETEEFGFIINNKETIEFSFSNVSYKYNLNEPQVLKNINLKINSPNFISIVGSTGSGKSTFIDILLGLLKPTSGEVLLNDKPLYKFNKKDLATKIGYVSQDIYLFDNSIKKNIAIGVPDEEINLDKLIEASKLAEIHDLIINDFKEGYDTEVGERGIKLSGGQIQRIGIARALYNESNIIILDEGTSNLDQATEAKVIKNISESEHTKLFIAIAHRLKTTINSDQIILFHNGEVQDIGSYRELEERNVIFKKMINA